MTASEFAFLALGLVLGFASGSAIVVVLGSRPPAREVRLTVGHDAVPRRAATLSADAFMAHNEPARGGPADRRHVDRDSPADDLPPPVMGGLAATIGRPVMGTAAALAAGAAGTGMGSGIRTTVPSWRPAGPANAASRPGAGERPTAAAIPISPERDPSVDALRVQAVLAAQRAASPGYEETAAVLDSRPVFGTAAEAATDPPATMPAATDIDLPASDRTPAIIRILRSDHRALVRTVEVLAGRDEAMRRPWQAAVMGLAEAVIRRAIADGVLDFPVGNPFWDTFTTGQCRAIAAALSASGYRFDGFDGWADERVPTYRELTAAVAEAGIEPRRIRAWPTQDQINALYSEVTVAADEYLSAHAGDLDLGTAQALAGAHTPALDFLWRHWEAARPILAGPVAPA